MVINLVAKILVVIGALNWGLIGVSNLLGGRYLNVVEYIFIELLNQTVIVDTIYTLVGIGAIITIISMVKGGE